MFADGKVPSAIGNSCAMPAAHSGNHECDCGQKDSQLYIYDSYEGPWCFCQDPNDHENRAQYCTPPKYMPEQINLQIAAADTIVVGFVTYEDTKSLTLKRPVAQFGPTGGQMITAQGISHHYAPPGRSNTTTPSSYSARYAYPYTMSYVKLGPLKPHTKYSYKVKSGHDQGVWSDTFEFTSLYSDGVTRLATYGDMGHSHYNSMDNMMQDCADGRINAIVHMGDHAYNIGFSHDRRGDAYMNAFQPTLTTCPWFPIIGNHEASDGDHYKHYEAIAYGESYGQTGNPPTLRSSATSALGHHLSSGTFYSMGLHGAAVPSNTSRFVSANIGLIHMVGLDLNNLDAGQLAWLDQDLMHAHNNRDSVPWIMVMSHFPIVSSKITQKSLSLEHYLQDENLRNYSLYAEGLDYVPCDESDDECLAFTVQDFQTGNRNALQPLFKKYKVDIYNAGHVHSYESTWPVCDFTKGTICNGKQDFQNPQGPVHITEGNGGVPGVKASFNVKNCTAPGGYCRKTASGGAYARITAYNATTLTYEHVQNNGSVVTDSWTIVQHNHSGQFDNMQ